MALYMIPNWFFGYDIALEVIFGVIALLVSFYSYKVYKISEQRESKIFSLAFLLISLSYFFWSAINLLFVHELSEGVKVIYLSEIGLISIAATYSHILLFMAGLVTLFYMTVRSNNRSMYFLLMAISLFAVLYSADKALVIYGLSSLYLLFILIHYVYEYQKNQNRNTLLFLVSFILLLFANVNLAVGHESYLNYVVVHFVELGAFLLILWSLLSVVNHGRQKKK